VEVVNDYFDLLAQKDIVRNRYTNYLSRVKATERLTARAKDREQIASVDQARQAELTARNNYVNAVATYQTSVNAFKIKLGLPVGEQVTLDDSALAELERTGLIPVPLEVLPAFRNAVETQLLILNSIDKFEDSKRKIRVAASQLRPGLNFFADASLQSETPTDYTRFDPDNVRAGVGVELDLPIDRLPQRNTYRATIVSFESEIRNLTLALDSLKDDIERGLRNLEQRRQNYEIQKLALELADRRVASTTLLLEAGRAEVRDLVEAQDAQIAAQNAVTAAIVSYQQARLQIMLDIGALDTNQEKFWLKDRLAHWGKTQSVAPPRDEQAVLRPPDAYFTN
jgi:outer membrane protein TolC